MSTTIGKMAFALFSLLFLCGAALLANYYINTNKETQQIESVLEIKRSALQIPNETEPLPPSSNDVPPDPADEEEAVTGGILPEYRELHELNSDIVGWVTVGGTQIDYPVMQRQREYYLNRGFDKKYSSVGLPFADEWCDLHDPSKNIFVYGHNIKNGAMFNDLLKYKDADFLDANPLILFDTLYERRIYSVVSAKSFIDRDIKKDFPDNSELLILMTCDYYAENGRFAVVAERIE